MEDQLQMVDEQINIFELRRVYGKQGARVAQAIWGAETDIDDPLLYQFFAKILAFSEYQRAGAWAYTEVIETFNNDVEKRFKIQIERFNQLVETCNGLKWILTRPELRKRGYVLPNLYAEALLNEAGRLEFSKEKYLEDILFEHFANWAEEHKVFRQVKNDRGISDIVMDSDKDFILIELKKGVVTGKALYQVFDYQFSYPDDFPKEIEMVVIASGFSDYAIRLARKLGITCMEYKLHELNEVPGLYLELNYKNKSNSTPAFNGFIRQLMKGMLVEIPLFNHPVSTYFKQELKVLKSEIEKMQKSITYCGNLLSSCERNGD